MPTPSMSPRNRPLASISTALLVGCGWLTSGTLPSRLGENELPSARASGVPAAATTSWFSATSRTCLCTCWNSTTCCPPLPLIG